MRAVGPVVDGEAGHLLGRNVKPRVDHVERLEDSLGKERVERLARNDLDQAAQYVGRNAVVELRSRLVLERQRSQPRDKLLQARAGIEDTLGEIHLVDGAVAKQPVSEARGVPQQVADRDFAAGGLGFIWPR